MKAILFALSVALLMVGCGEPDLSDPDVVEDATAGAVDWSKLQDRNGIRYLLNEETPFTGRAGRFHKNGQKWYVTNYKDGKKDGLQTKWWDNGQKMGEVNWKNGKVNGLRNLWHKNGQKWIEGNNKDDKEDGLWTTWYENGQKQAEENWKDGKFMSAKSWKPNGEKCPVTNVKDGNGVLVRYNDDGTEEYRATFKDGELVED